MSSVPMEPREALGSLELELQEIVNCQMWVLGPKPESFARAIHLTADPCRQCSNVLQLEYCYLLKASHTRSPGGLSHIFYLHCSEWGVPGMALLVWECKWERIPWDPQSQSPWALMWLTWQSSTGPLVSPHMTWSLGPEVEGQKANSATLYTSQQRWTSVVKIADESAHSLHSSLSCNIPGSLLAWVLKLQTSQGNWWLLLNTAKACISFSHLFRNNSPACAIFSGWPATWELKGWLTYW